MTRWLIRLAFPALGILVALIVVGVRAPENPVKPETTKAANTTMPSFEALVPAPSQSDGPDIVFKWQDSDGGWHYADQPPNEGPWHALAIEPLRGSLDTPGNSSFGDPDYSDLNSPYSAPFPIFPVQPLLPGNGS